MTEHLAQVYAFVYRYVPFYIRFVPFSAGKCLIWDEYAHYGRTKQAASETTS
jgi:hypothetical protein